MSSNVSSVIKELSLFVTGFTRENINFRVESRSVHRWVQIFNVSYIQQVSFRSYLFHPSFMEWILGGSGLIYMPLSSLVIKFYYLLPIPNMCIPLARMFAISTRNFKLIHLNCYNLHLELVKVTCNVINSNQTTYNAFDSHKKILPIASFPLKIPRIMVRFPHSTSIPDEAVEVGHSKICKKFFIPLSNQTVEYNFS